MRKINAYIARSVSGATLVVLLVIVSLSFISELVDQMRRVRADYTAVEAFIFSGLCIPSSIYDYLPLSCLIGCLIGLGTLASSSELTVIRAAGVSVRKIVWSVMRPIMVFIALGAALGEYVTPTTDQYKQSRRAIALGHQSALQGQRGVWNREGNEFMHFSAVLPNGKLYGITRMNFEENRTLLESTYVESAIFQGDHWFEKGGKSSTFSDSKVTTSIYDSRHWYSELSPDILDVLVLSADDLPMKRLYSYGSYLEKQGLVAQEYWLAFWKKALQPLAILSLVVVAISFIFGPLRQVTMGYRIFIGVIVGILFRISQDFLGPASLIFGFSPLIAVLAPQLVCFCVGLGLIKRSQ